MKKVSVLICTRNRSTFLFRCLSSLANQTNKPFEIIIVDNNSTDDTKTICATFPQLPIAYYCEYRIGLPYARNTSLQKAQGEIYAFIDDDCIAAVNWIERIVKHFNKNYDSVGVLGQSKNANPDNIYSHIECFFHQQWFLGKKQYSPKKRYIKSGIIVDFKNAAFKKNFIKNFRFSTDIPFGDVGDEDVELGTRLFNNNHHIYYDPSIIIKHTYSTSFARLFIRNFWNGYSNQLLLKKTRINTKTPNESSNGIHRFLDFYKSCRQNSLYSRLRMIVIFGVYPFASWLGRMGGILPFSKKNQLIIPTRK